MLTYYVRYFKISVVLLEIFYNSCVLINLIPFSLVGEVDEKQDDENKLTCIYLGHTRVPYSLLVKDCGVEAIVWEEELGRNIFLFF